MTQEDDVPTYAYACTTCDHRFEVQQAFTDSALTSCPQCEGRLRKLFNAVGIVFKGSGFYRTDSRRSGGGASSTTSVPSSPSGGSTSTSESTPSKSTTDATSSSSSTGTSSAKVPVATSAA